MSATERPSCPALTILFVDADARELSGTIRSLQRSRGDWDLNVVSTGTEALERVSERAIDVIVTDVELPSMTGVELLGQVRQLSPSTARVVLSAVSDRRAIFESTRVAHQYLEKPCNVERLKDAIDRIASCRAAVPAPQLHEVVGSVGDLPTPGPIHEELLRELRGDYSIAGLEQIVTSDVALTAELLRLVNSSFFGLVRRLERVGDAISFLGVDVLSALVAARSLFGDDADSPLDLDAINRHSRAVGSLAALAHGSTNSGTHLRTQAFATGLLHDVGVLVLGRHVGDGVVATDVAALLDEHDHVHERFTFGADRYSVGQYLLSLWGFEATMADAIGALAEPVVGAPRSGLSWTVRIAHEAVVSGRIRESDAIDGDETELKIALAEIVDELDVRGVVARPRHSSV